MLAWLKNKRGVESGLLALAMLLIAIDIALLFAVSPSWPSKFATGITGMFAVDDGFERYSQELNLKISGDESYDWELANYSSGASLKYARFSGSWETVEGQENSASFKAYLVDSSGNKYLIADSDSIKPSTLAGITALFVSEEKAAEKEQAKEEKAAAKEEKKEEKAADSAPTAESTPAEQPQAETPAQETPPTEETPPIEEQPPAETLPVETPPIETPTEQPPVEEPPVVEQPPVEEPPAEIPPVEQPPVEEPPVVEELPVIEEPPIEEPLVVEQPPIEIPPAETPAAEEILPEENITEEINATELNITNKIIIEFDSKCAETCLLVDGLIDSSYTLLFEVSSGTLSIDSVTYALKPAELMNETINFTKVKEDPSYDLIIDSANLTEDGSLVVIFHHDYDVALPIAVDGEINYTLSTETLNPGETATLIIPNYNDEYFRIKIGTTSEAFAFGKPKEENIEINVKDSKNQNNNASIKLVDKFLEKEEKSFEANKAAKVKKGEYDLVVTLNASPVNTIEFENITVDSDSVINIGVDNVPEFGSYVKVYAIDPTQFNFTNATVTVTATGSELYKCKSWDFATQNCADGNWVKLMDITPGQNYSFTLTPDDPAFGETRTITGCSCQSAGQKSPTPSTCYVYCPINVTVPTGAEDGYLSSVSYNASIDVGYAGGGGITAGSGKHAGLFDRDQTQGNGNESVIGTTNSDVDATVVLTNSNLTNNSAFNKQNCPTWASGYCSWYIFANSTVISSSTTKNAWTNITVRSINYTWNYTITIDATPPATVTNLNESSAGTTWIYWSWTNPADADFNHTEVWLDGVWKANVSKPTNYYNATGLNANTSYTIQTRTADNTGNINTTWVNDSATTLAAAVDNPPATTLLSPPDGNITTAQDLNFTCNATDDLQLNSITFYWDYGGSWQANDTASAGGTSNETTFAKTNLNNSVILWSCLVCDNASQCAFAPTNWTAAINYTANITINISVTVKDSQNSIINSAIEIIDNTTNETEATMSSGSKQQVNSGKKKIKVIPLAAHPVKQIEFNGVELTNSTDLELGLDNTPEFGDFTEVYAIDPTTINFTTAAVTATAKGTLLYKCAGWDFATRSCAGNWVLLQSITPGQDYTITINATDPGFGEVTTTSGILPNAVSNSDSDALTLANADELAPGDALYVKSGDTSEPSADWVQCGYPKWWSHDGIDTYTAFGAAHPFGITTVDASSFWVADDISPDTIFHITSNGSLLGSYSVPITGTHYGITTVNGNEFWVADAEYIETNFHPYVRHYNSTFGLIQSYDLTSIIGLDKTAQGITTVNGSEFWIADPDNDKVWKFNSTFGLITSYVISGYSSYASGITTVNGSEFWITDSASAVRKIFKTNSAFAKTDEFSTTAFNGTNLYGIDTVDGTEFWAVNNKNDNTDRIMHITPLAPASWAIQNMTLYWGHYETTGYNLHTTDAYKGVVWSPDGSTFYNVTDWTKSATDKDESYTLASGLPTASQFNTGIYFRFLGLENGGGADNMYLDYCYFTITYYIQDTVPPVITITSPTNGARINDATITLAATTNEAANCEYSTTSTFSYGTGTDFTTTGNISHSTSLGALSEGNYTYYAKCQDSSGNNNTNANQASVSFTVDRTPPETVTSLGETAVGESWIYWSWTNPADSDFDHAEIWVDSQFKTNISANYYNATGFLVNTTHTISIRTTDTAGNANTTWVSDNATTSAGGDLTPPAAVTNLNETAVGYDWILWNWTNPADSDFSHTKVYIDGEFKTNVYSPSNSYNATGFSPNTMHTISTQTVDTNNNVNTTWVNDSATTLADAQAPTYSNLIETPAAPTTYLPTQTYEFNSTWTDNYAMGVVLLEFDGINYTTTNASSAYTKTFTGLAAGTYNYRWHANDTSNNWNSTDSFSYIINKADSTINLTLNGVAGNITIERTGSANLTSTLVTPSSGTVAIYENGTNIGSGSSPLTVPRTYNTNGLYNITTTFAGNSNYNSSYETHFITAQDTIPPATITNLNESSATSNSIYWSWTNPADSDFNHTEVWINDVFKANVSMPTNYYNATALAPSTNYTIQTRTADNAGNINTTWMNDNASTLSGPINITGCTNINLAGTYYLQNNVSSSGTCFNIQANNVALDCAGYSITGNNSSATYGIYSNQISTTIKNCQISNFATGIYFDTADNGTIDNTTTRTTQAASGSNGYGIYLYNGANYNRIMNSNANASVGYGIYLSISSNNTISNTTATTTASNSYAIRFSSNSNYNTIANTTATAYNSAIFFQSSSNYNTISSSTVTANNYAIYLQSNYNTITNTNAIATSYAIYLDSGSNNTLIANTIVTSGTSSNGIKFLYNSQNNTLLNNFIKSATTYIGTASNSTNNNMTNTTFNQTTASLRFPTTITIPGNKNITQSNLNLTFNRVYLNSNDLTFLNTSAEITLRNLTFTEPKATVDYDDDGSFTDCPTNACTNLGYSGGTFVYNVTGFSAYSSAEGDTTPPGTVTDLNESAVGGSWIYWSWTNPADSDFSRTIIYIDGVWKANVSKPTNYYNATGLNSSTTYTIQTRTADTAGNINTSWVNDSVTTLCLESWQANYGSCLTNDTQFKWYADANSCGTANELPADNGTYVSCNYCSENITGPYYTSCAPTDNQTRYYTDQNYNSCCAITGLTSDCSIVNNASYANTTVSCDYCTTSWYEINTTCRTDDTKIGWYNDSNNCYAITGLPSDNNPPANNTYSCNYCSPAPTNTTWTDWQNQGSCLTNDTQQQNRSRIEYDANYASCYAITGLPSDLWNSGNNNTYWDYQAISCDYCVPSFHQVADSCQTNDLRTVWYNDSNSCYQQTGLLSDKPAANFTQSCDYCTPNIQTINGSCQPTDNYTRTYTDTNSCYAQTGLSADAVPASETVNCDYIKSTKFSGNTTDFATANLSNIEQLTLDKPGYGTIIFAENISINSSLDLDSAITISDNLISLDPALLPELNKPAILYFQNINFTDPKPLRNGVDCPETICTEISYDNTTGIYVFSVTGWSSYSVAEYSYVPPGGGGNNGGGGGGGSSGCKESWACTEWGRCANGKKIRVCQDTNNCSTTIYKPASVQDCVSECAENWHCADWGECAPEGIQARECVDWNGCETTYTKPEETNKCNYKAKESCSDGLQNNGEEAVDCGGPCKKCSTIPKLTGKTVAAYRSTNPLYAVPTILLLVALVGIITLSRAKLVSKKIKWLLTLSHIALIALVLAMLSLTFFESSIFGKVAAELPVTKEQINIGVIGITIIAGAVVLTLAILFVKRTLNKKKHDAHHWMPYWHHAKLTAS
jgi:hypothetical protein